MIAVIQLAQISELTKLIPMNANKHRIFYGEQHEHQGEYENLKQAYIDVDSTPEDGGVLEQEVAAQSGAHQAHINL